MKRYWLCRRCGVRVERTKQKCPTKDCTGKRPKPRVVKHAATLRDDSYQQFRHVNLIVHGPAMPGEWDADCCGVCGKAPTQERRHDRDHGHLRGDPAYGKPRGLACGGNSGCNILMLPWVTAAAARGVADAKRAAGEPDAERWELVAGYLERVDAYYRPQVEAAA